MVSVDCQDNSLILIFQKYLQLKHIRKNVRLIIIVVRKTLPNLLGQYMWPAMEKSTISNNEI